MAAATFEEREEKEEQGKIDRHTSSGQVYGLLC